MLIFQSSKVPDSLNKHLQLGKKPCIEIWSSQSLAHKDICISRQCQ